MKFIQNEHFYDSLSEKNIILPYYNKLTNALSQEILFEYDEELPVITKTISIALCPSFLDYSFFNRNKIILKKVDQKKIVGFAILTKAHQNLESFLKQEYKKSFRDNIKRFVNRLETCFNVKYEIHYGTIDKNLYNVLMGALQNMLKKRFNQRGDKTHALENWDHYLETTYSFILEKKASILAIYANEKLIHVCLNHHFKNILFVSIPSYDINYSKFALGNISIHKLLEWCIENKYYMLDMAYGEFDYKQRWSNHKYLFQHHIIAPKNNPIPILKVYLSAFIINIKNILKKFNIDVMIKKIKSLINVGNNFQEYKEYSIEVNPKINTLNLIKIDHLNVIDDNLQKAIYDFLYRHKVHIEKVTVLEIQESKSYLIYSKDITEKIIFS